MHILSPIAEYKIVVAAMGIPDMMIKSRIKKVRNNSGVFKRSVWIEVTQYVFPYISFSVA